MAKHVGKPFRVPDNTPPDADLNETITESTATEESTEEAAAVSGAARHQKKRKGWKIALISVGSSVLVLILAAVVAVYAILGRATIDPYTKETTYDGQDMLETDLPAIDENSKVELQDLPALDPIDENGNGIGGGSAANLSTDSTLRYDGVGWTDGTTYYNIAESSGSSGGATGGSIYHDGVGWTDGTTYYDITDSTAGSTTGSSGSAGAEGSFGADENPAPDASELVLDGNTMKKLIKSWCSNGQPVSSSSVLNILLIGVDHEDVSKNGRADSTILCSINTKTGTISLASLLRDQYTYISHGGREGYEKLNNANARGGPELMISTIEAHYKVQIDNYVMVSMATFPKIIDRLGGINITLTEEEAAALGSAYRPGDQWVNGEQALWYARLRSIDSEQQRTGRQRKVLSAIMTELSYASPAELIGVINDMMPYVRTGLTQTQMISLAGRAISEGWFNYSIQQFYSPAGKCWYGATVNSLWYWFVDYPVAAYDLQMKLYGKSNITLAADRKSFLKYPLG